jgi:hypothetical protein
MTLVLAKEYLDLLCHASDVSKAKSRDCPPLEGIAFGPAMARSEAYGHASR